MKKAKEQQGNLLFQSKISFIKWRINNCHIIIYSLLLPLSGVSQIANYVANGSFEQVYTCTTNVLSTVKYWNVLDSIGSQAVQCDYYSSCLSNVPSSGASFQYAKTGNSYIRLSPFCSNSYCSFPYLRTYAKNRLKNNLVAGKTYCVKMYVNLTNTSPQSIDALGILFSDNTIDTVKYSSVPLVYLNPQIQNPTNNIISDTLNWTLITGTFIANGSEKFLTIGNFKTDAATTKSLTGILPNNPWGEYFIDDVSCIPLDLSAYAAPGNDVWAIPGTTIYLGRPQDVGIDEACEWFKLPNATSVIATAAGITLTVAVTTNTYMVKQTICGIVNYDTVVVHASGVDLSEQEIIKNNVNVFPNPAKNEVNITSFKNNERITIQILDVNSKILFEKEVEIINYKANLKLDLLNGIYFVYLIDSNKCREIKKLIISK